MRACVSVKEREGGGGGSVCGGVNEGGKRGRVRVGV